MTVSFYATLRPIVGAKQVEIDLPEGSTVGQLVDHVVGRWPELRDKMLDEDGALSRHVHVFVNGRGAPYLEDGLATRLTSEHSVAIFPAVAGG